MPKSKIAGQVLSGRAWFAWFVTFCLGLAAIVGCMLWDHAHPDDAPLDVFMAGAICVTFLAFMLPVLISVWRDKERDEGQN